MHTFVNQVMLEQGKMYCYPDTVDNNICLDVIKSTSGQICPLLFFRLPVSGGRRIVMERCILTKDRQVAAGRFFGWTDLKTDVLRKE